jgi:hypothetical protein
MDDPTFFYHLNNYAAAAAQRVDLRVRGEKGFTELNDRLLTAQAATLAAMSSLFSKEKGTLQSYEPRRKGHYNCPTQDEVHTRNVFHNNLSYDATAVVRHIMVQDSLCVNACYLRLKLHQPPTAGHFDKMYFQIERDGLVCIAGGVSPDNTMFLERMAFHHRSMNTDECVEFPPPADCSL